MSPYIKTAADLARWLEQYRRVKTAANGSTAPRRSGDLARWAGVGSVLGGLKGVLTDKSDRSLLEKAIIGGAGGAGFTTGGYLGGEYGWTHSEKPTGPLDLSRAAKRQRNLWLGRGAGAFGGMAAGDLAARGTIGGAKLLWGRLSNRESKPGISEPSWNPYDHRFWGRLDTDAPERPKPPGFGPGLGTALGVGVAGLGVAGLAYWLSQRRKKQEEESEKTGAYSIMPQQDWHQARKAPQQSLGSRMLWDKSKSTGRNLYGHGVNAIAGGLALTGFGLPAAGSVLAYGHGASTLAGLAGTGKKMPQRSQYGGTWGEY